MLQSGMKFNNYKILCEHMSWKVYKSGSNSYKAQMKKLDSLCKWHKEKRVFVIDEVYSKPLLIQDNRRKKAIYIDYIRKTFLFSLYENTKNGVNNEFISMTTIIKQIGVFEEEFFNVYTKEQYIKMSSDLEVNNFILRGFKVEAFREVKRIVERALASLKRQNVIEYEEGKVIVTNDGECRFANQEELQIIKSLELEQLESMGCKNMASVKFRGLDRQFNEGLKLKFLDKGLGYIEYTFYGYKILSYDYEEAQLIDEVEFIQNGCILRNLLKVRLNEFAKGNHERKVKKECRNTVFGEPLLENNPDAACDYLASFERLIEYFIV